jgi:hypothetical protein
MRSKPDLHIVIEHRQGRPSGVLGVLDAAYTAASVAIIVLAVWPRRHLPEFLRW